MLSFIARSLKVMFVSFILGMLVIMFCKAYFTEQTNTFIANNQETLRKNNIMVATPEFMKGGYETDTQSTDPVVLKKSKVKNCDAFVKLWKPAHLPAGVKVECNNKMVKEQGNGALGYTLTQRVSPRHLGAGSIKIYLKDDTNIARFVEVYNHEAYHALSFSWSEEKQDRFLKALNASSWSEGDYMERASERWAWAATACYAKWEPVKGYEDLVPGKCKAVAKWINEN